jgi:hypothetical protein
MVVCQQVLVTAPGLEMMHQGLVTAGCWGLGLRWLVLVNQMVPESL